MAMLGRCTRGLTFPVPLHLHLVGLEEALVGQSGGGTRQHRVLVQTHEGRSAFTAWHVDGHLGREGAGSHSPGQGGGQGGKGLGGGVLTLLG